ncbi:MAG: hypothetical protein R2867_24625 [Caldilineaceae bacterium]
MPWSVGCHGGTIGNQATALAFDLDGIPAAPPSIAVTDGVAFDWHVELTPGQHNLQLSLPDQPAGSNSACEALCLRNLTIKLIEPLVDSDSAPLATFVTDPAHSDLRLTLLNSTILAIVTGADGAGAAFTKPEETPQSRLLLNTWRLDDKSATILHDAPTRMPVNYLHLTDAVGNIIAQADHRLGERHLLWGDQAILLDLVALPAFAGSTPPTELRLGLWYPQTERYFWSSDAADIDAVGRVKIGQLADLSTAYPLPTIPINKDLRTTFVNHTDGRTLTLINAYLTSTSVANGQLQLATTWAQSDLFIPRVSVTLFAHLTDHEGNTQQSVEHVVSPDELTWHDSILRYDQLNLPWDPTDANVQEIRIGLWYPDSGQRYQADATDQTEIDREGRVRLGTITELQRVR